MVGLFYLQHTFNLSDEAVVQRWIESWLPARELFRRAREKERGR